MIQPTNRPYGRLWRSMCTTLFALLAMLLFVQCSTDRDMSELYAPEDVGRLVVDGVLIVDKEFPTIRVSRAQRPDIPLDEAAAAERGARVTVTDRISGEVADYYQTSRPGEYATAFAGRVKPTTAYDLAVTTTSGEIVTATTTTPERFTIADWLLLEANGESIRRSLLTYEEGGDSVYFAPDNLLLHSDGLIEARFERPDVPAFQVGIISLDEESDLAVDPSLFEEEQIGALERRMASPALEAKESRIRIPWLALLFQGRYQLRLLALDPNTFDLLRSTPPENGSLGFGGNTGDAFERPIFHVNGGIGLFGSAAADSIGLFIVSPQRF